VNKNYFFLSGLPRTGSTLLCSILAQNSDIHTEGLSPVCETIWNLYNNNYNSDTNQWSDHLISCNRIHSIENTLKNIINLYYFDIDKKYIFDKCRTWTLPGNVNLIKKYITEQPKIIVLLRPLEEIISSFAKLQKINNWNEDDIKEQMNWDEYDPIIRGIISAKENNNGEFIFITYDDIVFNTQKTLNKIYDFCQLPLFEHSLKNIKKPFYQNDIVYNMIGLHEVRKNIEKQKYNIELPKNILKKCKYLNSLIFEE